MDRTTEWSHSRRRCDRPRGLTSLRQQTVAWIEAFADLCDDHGHDAALGRSARDLVARLRATWPAEVGNLPPYPAFR